MSYALVRAGLPERLRSHLSVLKGLLNQTDTAKPSLLRPGYACYGPVPFWFHSLGQPARL